MRLWGCHSARHAEVDIAGDRDGLRHLARLIRGGTTAVTSLDRPPSSWTKDEGRPLDALRLTPVDGQRLSFRREKATLVVSGERSELARIVASAIDQLVELPYRTSSVPLDATPWDGLPHGVGSESLTLTPVASSDSRLRDTHDVRASKYPRRFW